MSATIQAHVLDQQEMLASVSSKNEMLGELLTIPFIREDLLPSLK
jgi:hypothetical protein